MKSVAVPKSYKGYDYEPRTHAYVGIGDSFRASISKYDLTVRKIIVGWLEIDYGEKLKELHKLPITDHGIHKKCAWQKKTHVQWLDGILWCPKCEEIVEIG